MPVENVGQIYCRFDAALPKNLQICRPTHKTAEEYVSL